MRRLFHAATTITVALFFEDANKKSRVSKKNRAIPRTFPVRNGFFPQGAARGQKREAADRVKRTSSGEKTRLRNGENRAGRAENRWGVAAGRFRGRVPGRCGMPEARPGRGGYAGRSNAAFPPAEGRSCPGGGRGAGMAAVASVRGERAAHSENRRRARFRSPAAECGADGGDGPYVFAARMHASCDFPQQGRKKEVFSSGAVQRACRFLFPY